MLHYDGAAVGGASGGSFNTANLEVFCDLYLSAGSTAELRIEPGNDGATVAVHGFDLSWSYGAPGGKRCRTIERGFNNVRVATIVRLA